MQTVSAFGAMASNEPLTPLTIPRRDVGPDDIDIDILYCGVCHSDLHMIGNDWGTTVFPCVPGHEIVGRVSMVGASVRNIAPGDMVAVGCLVDSCRRCTPCVEGDEQYCENGLVGTYGSIEPQTGNPTYGGYSRAIVVDQNYVLKVPSGLEPARAAPLLCAGITTYSPLRHWNVGPGSKVGIAGIGGLGHLGIKFARAMGAHVVAFTTSDEKASEARILGAHEVVLSTNPQQMAAQKGKLDFIINTVSASHRLDDYMGLLARNGTMCLVGAPATAHRGPGAFTLLGNRRSLAGSMIGGIAQTQEMLDFCARHGVEAEIELIPIQDLDAAFERMARNDVRYRFVIDLSTLQHD